MLSLRKLAVAAALGVAAVAAGCASSPQAGPAAPSAAAATSETSADSKRPVSREVEGIEPTPTLLQVGGGQIQTIALPSHQIESAPGRIHEPSTRSPAAARRSIRATDVPGPAGPSRPGSRGIGMPWTQGAGSDPTAATAPSGPVVGEIPDPLAPPILTNSFDSTNFDTSGPLTGFVFIPPDAHAAAGPNHVVSVTNVVVQMHDKTGTSLCTIALADFFSAIPTTTELFDPKILYDQFADRWVVVALEQPPSTDVSQILLAVSDDSNPSDPGGMACGTWYQFAIDGSVTAFNDLLGFTTTHWTDYPGFAVDEEAIYVTGNLFPFSGGPFGGSRLWIVDKFGGTGGGFYGGGIATHSSALDPYAGVDCCETTTQPAHIFSTAPTTPNVGTYLVSYSGISEDFEGGTDEFVQIVRLDDPLPLASPKTFTQEFVNVGILEDLSPFFALPDAPQSGTAETIEVNDRRALSAVWRNNKLYMTATIDPVSGVDTGQATAHWWILDTTTPSNGADPPETVLTDQGSIGGEDIAAGTSTFFPALSVNAADEIAIGYSASDDSIFAGSYYTTRKPGDAVGTTSGSAVLRAGLDSYHRTFSGTDNRWGDYSGVALDPSDQCFWVYNQHSLCITGSPPCSTVTASNNGRWGTAFGKFCISLFFASCESSPLSLTIPTSTIVKRSAAEIIVTGTADVTATGDLTLEGETITFLNDFSVEGLLSVFTGFCPP